MSNLRHHPWESDYPSPLYPSPSYSPEVGGVGGAMDDYREMKSAILTLNTTAFVVIGGAGALLGGLLTFLFLRESRP